MAHKGSNPNRKHYQSMNPNHTRSHGMNPKHPQCRNPNHFHFQGTYPTRNIGYGHQVFRNNQWVQNPNINRGSEKTSLSRKKDKRFNSSGFAILISICSIVGMIALLASQYYHVAVVQNVNQTSIIMQQNELIRNQTELINQLKHFNEDYQGVCWIRATMFVCSVALNVYFFIVASR